jgi:hypothetical protein
MILEGRLVGQSSRLDGTGADPMGDDEEDERLLREAVATKPRPNPPEKGRESLATGQTKPGGYVRFQICSPGTVASM